MKNKTIKCALGINNKILIVVFFMSGLINLLYCMPKVAEIAQELYPTMTNETSKYFISVILDMAVIGEKIGYIVYVAIPIFILCCIIIIIKLMCKNKDIIKEIIIGHSSMSKMQFIPDTCSEFIVKELDLVDDMNDIDNKYDKIKYAINKQDKFIEEFKRNIDNKNDYGYMGIAHTPLIFRMGNYLGDEVTIKLFHKYRIGNTKKFKKLNGELNFKGIQIENEDLNKSSKELIVGISTTFPIKIDELKVLKPDSKNMILFKSEELGFDVITSEKQLENYVKFIMDKIRVVVKDKNISKIHMVLSTSVAMTFALGRAISKQHDPGIVVYHFNQNHPKKYTWGIEIFEICDKCLIVTKEESAIDM